MERGDYLNTIFEDMTCCDNWLWILWILSLKVWTRALVFTIFVVIGASSQDVSLGDTISMMEMLTFCWHAVATENARDEIR